MPSNTNYWAITGRVCGDDEDSAFVYGPCTRDEAIRAFRIDMREVSNLPTLDGEPDPIRDDPEGVIVFVNLVFRSDMPIDF